MNYIEFLQERAFSMGYQQRMFDEAEEKEKKNDTSKKLKNIALGSGIALGGSAASLKLGNKANKFLLKKVDELANTKVINGSSHALNGIEDYIDKKGYERLNGSGFAFVKYKKNPLNISEAIKYGRGNTAGTASALAHELGHGEYVSKTGQGGKLGKLAHNINHAVRNLEEKINQKTGKYNPISRMGFNNSIAISGALGGLTGLASGINAGKKEAEGKKEGMLSKIGAYALPVSRALVGLAPEAAASIKGHKILKASGASKEIMKHYRKHLGAAFGTYASTAAIPIGITAAARLGGKQIGKALANRKKKEEDNK